MRANGVGRFHSFVVPWPGSSVGSLTMGIASTVPEMKSFEEIKMRKTHRMRSLKSGAVLSLMVLCLAPLAGADSHRNATVELLQSATVNSFAPSGCFYFTLNGISQADPVVPGSPWFAVNRSTPASGDVYATILAAKLSGSRVWIVTNGTTGCGTGAGYPIAVAVLLEP
jgi:hypothetical protein